MTREFNAKRFELGVATWTEESTRPDTSANAANLGSFWLRASGNAAQIYLKTDTPDDTGWCLQNLTNLKVYNVQTFGAVGNSVTDDTAAINAAVTAAVAGGGGIVYFPALAGGLAYRLTKPATGFGSVILSGVHNLVFMGDGYASQLAMIGSAAGGDWYMFRLKTGTSHIRFWNLHFDGSGITTPDPNDQNHFISIEGIAVDVVGVSDVEVRECFFGPIVGDMVRNLGSFPAYVEDIRLIYNAQDADHCRSFTEAQRGTRRIQVQFNWIWGSDDQDIDFEPTGGGASVPPETWLILGNHIDHQSRNTDSITLSGINSSGPALRSVLAFNTITNGGQIAGLDMIGVGAMGNIVTVNSAQQDAVFLVFRVGEDLRIDGNVFISQSGQRSGIRLASNTGVAPLRCSVSNNVTVATEGTGISLECRDIVVDGNVVQVFNAVAASFNGIRDTGVVDNIDHAVCTGNLVLAGSANLAFGISYHAQGGFSLRNSSAIYNVIHGCTNGVVWDRATAETLLDWRGAFANLVINGTAGTLGAVPSQTGLTIEGSAGPGDQIAWINLAAGPAGNVAAPAGSLLTNIAGGQSTTIWWKDTGAGVSGGTTGWAQDGADELTMGALAGSVATTARFFATGGMGLTVESATEFKFAVVRPGLLRNLRIKCVAGTGGGNNTYTVRKNGVDTTLTFAVLNTGTTGSDTTHSVAVVAGDLISISVVKDAGPTTPQTFIQLSADLSG